MISWCISQYYIRHSVLNGETEHTVCGAMSESVSMCCGNVLLAKIVGMHLWLIRNLQGRNFWIIVERSSYVAGCELCEESYESLVVSCYSEGMYI